MIKKNLHCIFVANGLLGQRTSSMNSIGSTALLQTDFGSNGIAEAYLTYRYRVSAI